MVVDVGGDECVVIAVRMDEGRCMVDGVRSYWTFVVIEEFGIGQTMAIEVPICERILASSLPEIVLPSASLTGTMVYL